MDAEKKGSFVPKTITDGSPFAKGWSLVRWQHCNVTCAHKGTEPHDVIYGYGVVYFQSAMLSALLDSLLLYIYLPNMLNEYRFRVAMPSNHGISLCSQYVIWEATSLRHILTLIER